MFEGHRVGVVVPCYRVEGQIRDVLTHLPELVDRIFVIDDASPDRTAEIVEAIGDERITLLRHEHNQGVGGATCTGLAAALRDDVDLVVKMDGDGQMDPDRLPELLAPLARGEADLAKGNRYTSITSVRAVPLLRLLGNIALTFMVKLASGYWNLFDPSNGFVALRRGLAERLPLNRLPRGYYFESGLLVELGIRRAVVCDVPMEAVYGDEPSSLSLPRVMLTFPFRLGWGLMRRIFWRYFVLDFTAVSVLLLLGVPSVIGGVVFGGVTWFQMSRADVYTSPGLVMLAALPIILGVQFLLQALLLDVTGVPRRPISRAAALPPRREADERGPA